MSVARVTEISSRSEDSFEAAINEGIDRANKTLRNVRAAWIKEQSVDIEDGGIVGLPRQHAGDVRPGRIGKARGPGPTVRCAPGRAWNTTCND